MSETSEELFYYVVRGDASRYSSIGTAKDEASAIREVNQLRNQRSEYGFNYSYFVAAVPVKYDGSWDAVKQAIYDKYAGSER